MCSGTVGRAFKTDFKVPGFESRHLQFTKTINKLLASEQDKILKNVKEWSILKITLAHPFSCAFLRALTIPLKRHHGPTNLSLTSSKANINYDKLSFKSLYPTQLAFKI